MTTELLIAFFKWCVLINVGLMSLTAVLLITSSDWVYKVHHRWFPLERHAFNVAIYCFLGLWKILFFLFCLIPYIALHICT